MRLPCPHCGSQLLGVGWGQTKTYKRGKSVERDYCRVMCRRCFASGPWGESDKEAWSLWNSREVADMARLDNHLKLCRRNLKLSRVVCCASCPFEKLIVGHDPGISSLFDAKRRMIGKRK